MNSQLRDPTHVDYVPTLLVFTTEEQRVALKQLVKKHEQMLAMKKRRLDGRTKMNLLNLVRVW